MGNKTKTSGRRKNIWNKEEEEDTTKNELKGREKRSAQRRKERVHVIYHQQSFVGVDGSDENSHVITLTVLVLRPDFGVILARVRLHSAA